jgi:hypothetical protein
MHRGRPTVSVRAVAPADQHDDLEGFQARRTGYCCSITAFLAAIRVFFRSRVDTSLEVLALRQQVGVRKRKRPRPSLNRLDRLF